MFSRGLLLFWSLWLSVVFLSNLADGWREAGFLPPSWPFASGNFGLIRETIGIYGLGTAIAAILFAAVVVIELAAAVLFWRALLDRETVLARGHPKVLEAFFVAAGLFAAFLVADEVFIVYDRLPALETTHLLVLVALLASWSVISRLADSDDRDRGSRTGD